LHIIPVERPSNQTKRIRQCNNLQGKTLTEGLLLSRRFHPRLPVSGQMYLQRKGSRRGLSIWAPVIIHLQRKNVRPEVGVRFESQYSTAINQRVTIDTKGKIRSAPRSSDPMRQPSEKIDGRDVR
jgi:hypothetical protein